MRDSVRIDKMLSILRIYWGQNPDMRLGQILSNAAFCGGWNNPDIFSVEDDMTYEGLLRQLQTQAAQRP